MKLKKTLVAGNAGDEENLHNARKFIVFNQFN